MGSSIRSVYAWVLLSAIMLPLFPAAWIVHLVTGSLDPRRDRFRVFVARWVSLYARFTPLYRFEVEGRSRLPVGAPYVLVANHESGLDVLSLLCLQIPARFLADAWMFRLPLAGWLFRACCHIPVKQGDRDSGRRALATAVEALSEGSPVAIFPEGEYSEEPSELEVLRPGAFVAAQRAGVPIVPVLLEGSGNAWRPGTLVVQGYHRIRIAILAPIPAEEVASGSPDELAERVRKQFEQARHR